MSKVTVDSDRIKVLVASKKKAKQSEFVRWFAPLVQALKDLGGSAAAREALERIAEIEKVPEELRNEVLSSGQERFYNQVLKSLSPSGLERLSLRLLREAGFERVSVTGRSNDGGIDGVGVLQLNHLVSFERGLIT